MSTVLKYPMGSVLQFTCGAYSDFRNVGLVVSVKDIDLPVLVQGYRDEFVPDDYNDNPSLDGFSSWLCAKGFAMPVQVGEIYLGEYGKFDGELVNGAKQ